ncbi:DUF6261 family protein [Ekhidna sp. To15]|uniref:DUF6261 family protein n=1 Tax=Ekhidna sp. To15 TaxID=3395267 RepID=UPI003F51B57C
MIISKIPYSLLGLKGMITLVFRILELMGARHAGEAFLQGSIAKLQAVWDFASNAVGTSRKLSGTKSVTEADDKRDDSFEALKWAIKGGMKRTNSAVSEAAERLYAVLEKNGLDLAKLPYDEETAALQALFRDLDQAEAQADLAAVYVMDCYNELKSHQADFEEAVSNRGEERTTKAPTNEEAMRELKPKLRHLFKMLDVAEEEELVEDIASTNVLVNSIIKEIVDANRRGSGHGDDEEDEQNEEIEGTGI